MEREKESDGIHTTMRKASDQNSSNETAQSAMQKSSMSNEFQL